ncbi:hypothetical protein [Bradyrhizobium sp. S3.7.6]
MDHVADRDDNIVNSADVGQLGEQCHDGNNHDDADLHACGLVRRR